MVKVVYLLPKTRPDAEVNEVLNSRWPELIIVNGYPGEWPRNKWSTNDLRPQVLPTPRARKGRHQSKHRVQVFCFLILRKRFLAWREKEMFLIKYFQPLLRHSNLQFSILGRSLLLGRLVVNTHGQFSTYTLFSLEDIFHHIYYWIWGRLSS